MVPKQQGALTTGGVNQLVLNFLSHHNVTGTYFSFFTQFFYIWSHSSPFTSFSTKILSKGFKSGLTLKVACVFWWRWQRWHIKIIKLLMTFFNSECIKSIEELTNQTSHSMTVAKLRNEHKALLLLLHQIRKYFMFVNYVKCLKMS